MRKSQNLKFRYIQYSLFVVGNSLHLSELQYLYLKKKKEAIPSISQMYDQNYMKILRKLSFKNIHINYYYCKFWFIFWTEIIRVRVDHFKKDKKKKDMAQM